MNQSSGVSVRVTLNNYETVIANAERRAVRLGENEIVPRISDLHAVSASMMGKLELEYRRRPRDRSAARAPDEPRDPAVFDRSIAIDRLGKSRALRERLGRRGFGPMRAEEYPRAIRAILAARRRSTTWGCSSRRRLGGRGGVRLRGPYLAPQLNKDIEEGTTYRS